MDIRKTSRRFCVLGILSLGLAATGCRVLPDRALIGPASDVIVEGFNAPPRTRFGGYAAAIPGMTFLGEDLGAHNYHWPFFEKNGIVYTCKGGHIDIVHMRLGIDWTAYLAAKSYQHLMRRSPGFSTRFSVDRSRFHVRITYPPGWDYLTKKDRSAIAEKMAMAIGPYLTFSMITWHEILTWYGYKSMVLPVEFNSAFSWEDSYSHLLGTVIAMRALQDTERPYAKAVRVAIDEEMQRLGILAADEALEASRSVQGEWYTGVCVFFFDMKKRNFDIGLDNGYVTPTLVPDVPGCEGVQPLSYPVPTLDILDDYGFSLAVEIEPREWERDRILRVVFGDEPERRIDPQEHFAIIMDDIQREATARYGPQYDPANRRQEPLYVYTGE